MPVHRYRFVAAASIASLALFAAAARHSFAQQPSAQQIVLSNIRGLDFGRFAAGRGGTVSVSRTGTRSTSGGVVLLNSSIAGMAMFNVSRNSNEGGDKAVVISLPPDGTTHLHSHGGGNSMAVDSFVDDAPSPLSIPSGGRTLSVGATLIVAPNQAPGHYSGTFSLIVNFE